MMEESQLPDPMEVWWEKSVAGQLVKALSAVLEMMGVPLAFYAEDPHI